MVDSETATRLRLIDRAVTTLSRSTEALLRAQDEKDLLADVCRIAVEVAGYRLAWIGLSRPDELKTVAPVAQAGSADEYVQRIKVSWGDGELGHGPVGTAIRTGTTQVVTDTDTDASFAPWREAARQYGFRSVAALPLIRGDQSFGALAIYSSEPASFGGDALRLLEDLAHNLSYGIASLRVKAEHERAVRDLAESEERYRSLVELIPDAILVHAQETVVFANPASAALFGAESPLLLAGRPVDDFVHQDDRALIERRLTQSDGAARDVIECRMVRLDGTEFDGEMVTAAITFHGLPARLLVVRDVTDSNLMRQQMVQTAKLATLGEMAAGLVHELSQPLNIMRLTAEGALLFIERGKATPEWQAQQFELIADQAQRTAEIIGHIRIFSRRDTTPDITFDALASVRSAIGTLEGQLRPEGIRLDVDLPVAPMPVRGRPIQLEQVILNLLSNAHHAVIERRESCGETSYVPQIQISARLHKGQLVIGVTDNGPGLTPQVRSRIFEPFFTTKEPGRGTGLGLSISFGIVSAMGGRLEVVEHKGGARFAVTLPLDGSAVTTAPPSIPVALPTAAIPPGDSHIMVVDDEQAAAQSLTQNLREVGYRVTLCTSGSEALERFMSDPADVIITDLRMPAGNGEQLVEKLRDYDPLLPVVIVTGYPITSDSLSEKLRDDRCIVIKKPIAFGHLTDTITVLLQPPSEVEEA